MARYSTGPGNCETPDEARKRAIEACDRALLSGAQRALAEAGCTALEFLAANPALSNIELAKQLNRGTTAIGLVMAIYDEAARRGIVRDTAKDMLIREICGAFPHGWPGLSLVSPLVKIGSWDSEVNRYGRDPRIDDYAGQIIRHLAIEHPPPRYWKPELKNDPLIDDLFDRYWPVD